MRIFKNTLIILIILINQFDNLIAQNKLQITGTNLKLGLADGFVIDANSAMITSQDYEIVFMEMADINFYDQIEDFKDIKSEYANKGIIVKKSQNGKIGKYDAIIISLDTKPSVYQAFFGDKEFCALATITANDTIKIIDENELNFILSTIEYEKDNTSALERHANFYILDKNYDWEFQSYVANAFAFENKNSKDGVLITQLPSETLIFSTKESLGEEFVSKYRNKMPNIKVIEQGNWQTKKIEGYRILLDVTIDGNGNLGLIYIFIFRSNKSTFVFNGLGNKNDPETMNLFENFLSNLTLKE